MLGLWDRNPIKLDYDGHCTTINVINSLCNKKKFHGHKKKKKKFSRSSRRGAVETNPTRNH